MDVFFEIVGCGIFVFLLLCGLGISSGRVGETIEKVSENRRLEAEANAKAEEARLERAKLERS